MAQTPELQLQGWSPQETKEAIARDEYLGYELDAARKLHARLPQGREDFEDVLDNMRLYALEAVLLYDPSRKAKFSTFLYRHLQLRCFQWFRWAWLPGQRYQLHGPGVANFTAYEAMSSSEDGGFDPTRVTERKHFRLEVAELVGHLSEESRHIFNMVYYCFDGDLIEAFKSEKSFEKVSSATGLTPTQVRGFVYEFRLLAPEFLTGIA